MLSPWLSVLHCCPIILCMWSGNWCNSACSVTCHAWVVLAECPEMLERMIQLIVLLLVDVHSLLAKDILNAKACDITNCVCGPVVSVWHLRSCC